MSSDRHIGRERRLTDTIYLDEEPNIASRRDTIMIRLLDSSIRILSDHGMKGMFIDAVKGGDEGFQSMGEFFCLELIMKLSFAKTTIGFQKWARYREVWREV